MANAIDEEAKTTVGKKQLAMEAFARALRQLPTIIADNAGLDSAEIVRDATPFRFGMEVVPLLCCRCFAARPGVRVHHRLLHAVCSSFGFACADSGGGLVKCLGCVLFVCLLLLLWWWWLLLLLWWWWWWWLLLFCCGVSVRGGGAAAKWRRYLLD
jgi:hypothetical protein